MSPTPQRKYLIVRLLTGMRTGEIHGLKWKYVDFEHHQILVRETIVRGKVEYTKTDGSQREIAMSQPVYEALVEQKSRTGEGEYVFCTATGAPIDNDNFTNRVWYPLLRHLELEKRRPYRPAILARRCGLLPARTRSGSRASSGTSTRRCCSRPIPASSLI